MTEELRILIVEDVATDAELMERSLAEAGIKFVSHLVDDKAALLRELKEFAPDILLSDFGLPGFDGMDVLKLAAELAPGIPVVIVTGSINEETAVECIKAGAEDYVLKHHLKHLPSAVQGAIEHCRAQADREEALQALRQSEERFRVALLNSPAAVCIQDRELRYTWSHNRGRVCGGEDPIGKLDEDLMPPAEAAQLTEIKRRVLRSGVGERSEVSRTVEGNRIWIDLTVEPLRDTHGEIIGITCAAWDITERKLSEEQLQEAHRRLREEHLELERKNIALREVLNQIESERKRTARQLQTNVERIVLPTLSKLETKTGDAAQELLMTLRASLSEITSPFVSQLESQFAKLTPREVEICNLIRNGRTSKEIAQSLDTSLETVRSQRKSIRKKLSIDNAGVNLSSYLRTISN